MELVGRVVFVGQLGDDVLEREEDAYVSTKWRSSCTWKPWSTAWSFSSVT